MGRNHDHLDRAGRVPDNVEAGYVGGLIAPDAALHRGWDGSRSHLLTMRPGELKLPFRRLAGGYC